MRVNHFAQKFSKYSLVGVIAMVMFFVTGILFAEPFLVVRQAPCVADAIVVLTGETKERASKTVELYKSGYAPKIIVSGKDAEEIQITTSLIDAGIPVEAIFVDDLSKNTYENARFSRKISNSLHAKSIIVVTSWFHSRRATATFKAENPDIEIYSVPTSSIPIQQCLHDKRAFKSVFWEYIKLAYYSAHYKIDVIS